MKGDPLIESALVKAAALIVRMLGTERKYSAIILIADDDGKAYAVSNAKDVDDLPEMLRVHADVIERSEYEDVP